MVDSGGQGLFRLFQGPRRGPGRPVTPMARRARCGTGSARPRPQRPRPRLVAARRRGRSGTRRCSCSSRGRHEPRRRRHPAPPRGDRRVGRSSPATPGGQGPRPQRAARPGHRLRTVPGHAEPDHVENLDHQASDVREARAQEFVAAGSGAIERLPTPDEVGIGVFPRPAGDDLSSPRRPSRGSRSGSWPSHRGRTGGDPRRCRDAFREHGRSHRARRPVGQPAARASCSRPFAAVAPTRSSSCPITRTSSSPPARSRRLADVPVARRPDPQRGRRHRRAPRARAGRDVAANATA